MPTLYNPVSLDEGENGISSVIDLQEQPISNPYISKISKSSDGESSSNSPGSQTLSSLSSGGDYLDSDLVNAAIELLNIDDVPVITLYCHIFVHYNTE